MYHHANTNIDASPSSDCTSTCTKSSEGRRRQIPLAFTNTGWGREYLANPNWEQENLGRNNAPVRQGSRVRSGSDGKNIPASIPSPNASTKRTAHASSDPDSASSSAQGSLPVSPSPHQSCQQYSAMASWTFFRRTFPQPISPTSPDTEKRESTHPEQEETVGLGPWLEMLMRWDDFEQWRLEMLQRAWYSHDDAP